jgi:hypothetical protein
MRELIAIFNAKLSGQPQSSQKPIAKFIQRLESYVHVPSNEKEYLRMATFADQPSVANLYNGKIKNRNAVQKWLDKSDAF